MAAWLRHRGWRAGWMHLVVWLPILVLAAPAALGWLAPAGLVLWGPVSTMLAAALAMAAHPLAPAGHADAPSHP
jgi:hypothetical protein